ncbi:MAG: hypothetical protein AAFQ58_11035 [Pseudomonadota bacterium]
MPLLWPPKDASAGLRVESADQKTFVHLCGPNRADDVQIKFRPVTVIARHEPGRGWSGVGITGRSVRALVGDTWVENDPMGTVTQGIADSASITFLEFDGSII